MSIICDELITRGNQIILLLKRKHQTWDKMIADPECRELCEELGRVNDELERAKTAGLYEL